MSSATPASLSQHPLQRDPCVEALVLPCRAEGLAVAAEAGWPPASASPHLRGLSQVGWDRQSVPLTHGSWNAGTHGASVGTAHVVTNMAKKNSFSRFLLPAALWPMERPARQRRLAPCALHAGVPSHAHLTAQRPEHRKCPRACGRGSLAWGQPYLRTAPRPACTARSPARGAARTPLGRCPPPPRVALPRPRLPGGLSRQAGSCCNRAVPRPRHPSRARGTRWTRAPG